VGWWRTRQPPTGTNTATSTPQHPQRDVAGVQVKDHHVPRRALAAQPAQAGHVGDNQR
jgi:hypothetical protein